MTPRIRQPGWLAAALIALLMLGYASVRSTVMQAAMTAPTPAMPMCDGGLAMTDMADSHDGRAPAGKPAPPPSKSCPYCAAAAHPPLTAQPVVARPCTTVSFVAYRAAAPSGPIGPPSRRPRARDPPLPA